MDELRAAALAYVKADLHYRDTYRLSGQEFEKPLNRETHAACRAANHAQYVMNRAAYRLAIATGEAMPDSADKFAFIDSKAEGAAP